MTDLIHFPTTNIAIKKAHIDQTHLLDMIADSHDLMTRASRLVADDAFKTTPEGRDLLGRAADWMRLFEQTVALMELEKAEVA